MEAPNRVPPGRLSLQLDRDHLFRPLGCRHGLALLSGRPRQQLLVWDPLTGEQHHLPVPPGFDPETTPAVNGAVLRRAAGDVHFQVVFVAAGKTQALACVYSSETGTWGDLVSTPVRRAGIFYARFCDIISPEHAVLVGDSLYWQLTSCASSILEFDLEKRSLAVIPVPVNANHHTRIFRITRAVGGGGLGFLFVSGFAAQLWERIVDCDGVASWVLATSIELDKILSLGSEVRDEIEILGIAEENNTVFLTTGIDVYALQLQSLQFKKLSEFNITDDCYPFESVYTAETDIGGNEHDEAALLHNA